MTAVASIIYEGIPMMVGDLLVSGLGDENSLKSVPTQAELSPVFSGGEGRRPKSLCQKISILADNLAVGWAGPFGTAQDLIQRLRVRNMVHPFTGRSLDEFLNNEEPEVFLQEGGKSLSLICLVSEGHGQFSQVARNAETCETKLFGRVVLLGSGGAALSLLVKDVEKFLAGLTNLMLSREQLLASIGLQLGGVLMRVEMQTGESLRKEFGGGYEVLLWSGGRFVKIESVTHLFWTVAVRGRVGGAELAIRRPSSLCRYAYADGLLRIRALRLPESGDALLSPEKGDNYRAESDLYLVPPVYRSVLPAEEKDSSVPSLAAEWVCNHVYVVYENGRSARVDSQVLHGARIGERVRFSESEDGRGEVGFSRELVLQIAKSAVDPADGRRGWKPLRPDKSLKQANARRRRN